MTLAEALITATLSSIVAATGVAVLRAQTQAANQTTIRSERNDATRAAALTLQSELDTVDPRTDVRAAARDSINARIFRGVAIVCAVRDSMVTARYRGLRLPDAAKDSALQVGVENGASIRRVFEGDGCLAQADERVLQIVLSAPAAIGSMWIVFENGSYQLHTNALRYRRDSESRQPVTAEIIDVRQSGFFFAVPLKSIDMRIAQRGSAARFHASIRLLNAE